MAPRIVQVINVSPNATPDQLKTLFSFIGSITEIKVYPSDEKSDSAISKVCYVQFEDSEDALVALHLNNTVFVDRAIIVTLVDDSAEEIPDEYFGMRMRTPNGTTAGIPPRCENWPWQVVSVIVGQTGNAPQQIYTIDPQLEQLGLAQYPPLPASTDTTKLEEIRRTVAVSNLDSSITSQNVLDFFNPVAPVKFVRMTGKEIDPVKTCLVEFCDQPSVRTAYSLNGAMLGDRPLIIAHASTAIIKTSGANDERDKDSRRHRHRSNSRSRSRSRSRKRHRHRSRSKSRSGSRSHRRKSRSRDRDRRRTSRDRDRDRDRDRERERDKDKDKKTDSRHRSRSRDREKRRSRSGEDDRSASSRNSRKEPGSSSKDATRKEEREKKRSNSRERDRGGAKDRERSERTEKDHSASASNRKDEKSSRDRDVDPYSSRSRHGDEKHDDAKRRRMDEPSQQDEEMRAKDAPRHADELEVKLLTQKSVKVKSEGAPVDGNGDSTTSKRKSKPVAGDSTTKRGLVGAAYDDEDEENGVRSRSRSASITRSSPTA